jgi:hypothetical protein
MIPPIATERKPLDVGVSKHYPRYVCDALQASRSKKCRSMPDQRHKGAPESAILLVFTASA